MYSTQVYIYQQILRVLMMDTGAGETFTYRYDPVYAKRLTINKGVDNVILFEFVNQDQKPVNITGSTLTFRLIDQSGVELLDAIEMVVLNAQYGRAKVTIPYTALNAVQAQPASYSISRASGNLVEAVFTDAQAGARADVDIVDSVYPEFIQSAFLTIPTTQLGAQGLAGGTSSMFYPDWALQANNPMPNTYAPIQSTEYFSSFIEPTSAVTTIQMDLVGYTGTIKVQGAENYQSLWYDVTESFSYLNKTGTIHINVLGWHPILRVGFNNSVYTTGLGGNQLGWPAQANVTVSNGVVTSVGVTVGGYGYLAPPLCEIIGDGAGAVLESQVENGSVTAINVISGGSGYRPNPPTNTGAVVVISCGRAENLRYR